jgi:hypothetical protein
MSLDDHCCTHGCTKLLGQRNLQRQAAQYEALKTSADQDLFIMEKALWSATMCRPTGWCNVHLKRLFGVTSDRLAWLRSVVAELQGRGSDRLAWLPNA